MHACVIQQYKIEFYHVVFAFSKQCSYKKVYILIEDVFKIRLEDENALKITVIETLKTEPN